VRWYFWQPAQRFIRLQLQSDGTWKKVGTMDGPFQYLELGVWWDEKRANDRLVAE